jgi:hypothetical protein
VSRTCSHPVYGTATPSLIQLQVEASFISVRYCDTLGLFASSSAVTVRQDLIGGSYALLEVASAAASAAAAAAALPQSAPSWRPLPDYWIALAWKQLMGQDVLLVDVTHTLAQEQAVASASASAYTSASSPSQSVVSVYSMCLRGNYSSGRSRGGGGGGGGGGGDGGDYQPGVVVLVVNKSNATVALHVKFTSDKGSSSSSSDNMSCSQVAITSSSLQSKDVNPPPSLSRHLSHAKIRSSSTACLLLPSPPSPSPSHLASPACWAVWKLAGTVQNLLCSRAAMLASVPKMLLGGEEELSGSRPHEECQCECERAVTCDSALHGHLKNHASDAYGVKHAARTSLR